MVNFLIENGANIEAKNNEGVTPLLHAASRGHLKSIQLNILQLEKINLIMKI